MNCDEIRSLIITEYLDNEMSDDLRQEVDQHIHSCRECKEFLAQVKKEVFEPLLNVQIGHAPDNTWENIKEHIEDKESSNNPIVEWVNHWKERLTIPQVAWSMVVVVLLGIIIYQGQPQNIQHVQQDNYSISDEHQMQTMAFVTEEFLFLAGMSEEEFDGGLWEYLKMEDKNVE